MCIGLHTKKYFNMHNFDIYLKMRNIKAKIYRSRVSLSHTITLFIVLECRF